MICKNCGRENSNESKICMYCGNNLSNIEAKNKFLNFKINKNKYVNNYDKTLKKENSNLLKWLVLVTVIVVFIFVGLVFYKNYAAVFKIDFEQLYLSNSFFLNDLSDNKKYYLYDSTGTKVLDSPFYSVSKFYDKVSIVHNEENKVGLIDETGKMVIEFSKYLDIKREGFLYKITDSSNKKFLVDKNNKKIADLQENSLLNVNSDYFSILKTNDKYKILDYKGKKLLEIAKVGSSLPRISVKSGYLSLFYNDINYLFDLTISKKILQFQDPNHYCVNSVNKENTDEIILNVCGDESLNNRHDYKYIKNKKILKTISDECLKLGFSNGNLICQSKDDNKNYIYSRNLYKSFLTTDTNINYISDSSYIKKENDKISFYKNDKKVKELDCYLLASTSKTSYLYKLKTIDQDSCNLSKGMFAFFDVNGKKINDSLYKHASDFDKNGNSIVGINTNTYFLIDKNGNKISDDYQYINYVKTNDIVYYLAANSKQSVVLDKNGKEIYTLEKNDVIDVESVKGKDYLIIKNKDYYSIYDIENSLMLVQGLSSYVLTNDYITTLDGNSYFSYRGTLITKK